MSSRWSHRFSLSLSLSLSPARERDVVMRARLKTHLSHSRTPLVACTTLLLVNRRTALADSHQLAGGRSWKGRRTGERIRLQSAHTKFVRARHRLALARFHRRRLAENRTVPDTFGGGLAIHAPTCYVPLTGPTTEWVTGGGRIITFATKRSNTCIAECSVVVISCCSRLAVGFALH